MQVVWNLYAPSPVQTVQVHSKAVWFSRGCWFGPLCVEPSVVLEYGAELVFALTVAGSRAALAPALSCAKKAKRPERRLFSDL